MSRRMLWGLLLVLLSLPIAFGVIGVGWLASLLPPPQAERITGPEGLLGVVSSGSFVWIVPTDTGVVLIDAGLDPKASVVKEAVGDRPVKGILLTHAHADHTGGLAAWPDVPVWVGTADRPLLDGSAVEQAPLAVWSRQLGGKGVAPKNLSLLTDGQDLDLDGARFHVTDVPGVTPGSVAILWHKVLFTGDAVWGGPGLQLPPDALCESQSDAHTQPKRLLSLDFDTLADGQIGLATEARPKLFRLLGETLVPPKALPTERPGGPREVRTGWLVRAPGPDSRGEQPEWLVVPGKDAWRLSSLPDPAHDALVDQWVTVEGRASTSGGPRLAVDTLTPATGAPTVPAPTSVRNLEPWIGRYVTVAGTLRDFAPLTPGAAWGEGTLQLADGTTVPVHAPIGAGAAGPVSWLVRVEKSDAGVVLVAPRGA